MLAIGQTGAYGCAVASRFNTEFDSRVLRVSTGAGGITRPRISQDGHRHRTYCLNCGKPAGAVEAIGGDLPLALRNDPGVIYICEECDAKMGRLPAHAISFSHRRES